MSRAGARSPEERRDRGRLLARAQQSARQRLTHMYPEVYRVLYLEAREQFEREEEVS